LQQESSAELFSNLQKLIPDPDEKTGPFAGMRRKEESSEQGFA